MAIYAGTGKNAKEIRLDETEVRLWDVTVNGEKTIYRGTEHAVTEYVWNKFYWDAWDIAPHKFLALKSQIIDITDN